MNITKRLYTYPVLSEERDDYTDSVFDADVQYKMKGVNNLLFDFDIEMDNKELQKMILEGDAEYVVHIECANTSYRTTIHDISNHVSKAWLAFMKHGNPSTKQLKWTNFTQSHPDRMIFDRECRMEIKDDSALLKLITSCERR